MFHRLVAQEHSLKTDYDTSRTHRTELWSPGANIIRNSSGLGSGVEKFSLVLLQRLVVRVHFPIAFKYESLDNLQAMHDHMHNKLKGE